MLCDLVPIKRVYEMILSLAELHRRGFHLRLHLGGDPRPGGENERYFTSVKGAIKRLDLTDSVVFHGWVTDPVAWFRDIDIFISNSYWEGQQNALVEAMASGCHCLAHFWDGVDEILPSEYVYATESELIEKITRHVHSTDADRQAHRDRLREIVEEKFELEEMRRRILEILLSAAES